MRRAKIVATLGPATSSYDDVMAVLDAGANIFRMNLSHGARDVHEEIYSTVRRAADDSGKPIGVLVDLQGPKIRLEKFADGPHELKNGDTFTITTRDVEGTKDLVGTTYKGATRGRSTR
jgi:Pyruvate kinase